MLNQENTAYAQKMIFSADTFGWDDNPEKLFASLDYVIELEQSNPIKRGILEKLQKLGIVIDSDNNKDLKEELIRRYEDIGIKVGSTIEKTLDNWIAGQWASPAQNNRPNMYNLCLSLEMSVDETKDFFRRYFMTIPFNYKDRVDASYYYGFLRKKTYSQIQDVLSECEKRESCMPDDKATESILFDINDIEDDAVFAEYLISHTYDRKQQYRTAHKVIKELLKKCAHLATEESNINYDTGADDRLDRKKIIRDKHANNININGLMSVIYGDDAQRRYREKKRTNVKDKMTVAQRFWKKLPHGQEFSQIESGKASQETYRRAIIILNFYHFFLSYELLNVRLEDDVHLNNGEKKIEEADKYYDAADLYDQFKDETSSILVRCGFVELYERNPFDWVVLFCAWDESPLECMRTILTYRAT